MSYTATAPSPEPARRYRLSLLSSSCTSHGACAYARRQGGASAPHAPGRAGAATATATANARASLTIALIPVDSDLTDENSLFGLSSREEYRLRSIPCVWVWLREQGHKRQTCCEIPNHS